MGQIRGPRGGIESSRLAAEDKVGRAAAISVSNLKSRAGAEGGFVRKLDSGRYHRRGGARDTVAEAGTWPRP